MNTVKIYLKALLNLLFIAIAWVGLLAISAPQFIIATICWSIIKPFDENGKRKTLISHLVGVLYGQDQLINQMMCGNPDSTISGRTGYWAMKGDKVSLVMERVINAIMFWDEDHCRSSIEGDEPETYPWVF